MRKIVVAGATSAIAEATCRLFAENGDKLYLVGRRQERLNSIRDDLKVRGADKINTQLLDLSESNEHKKLLETAKSAMDGVDMLLVAYGTLPDQKACEASIELALQEFNTNCSSVLSLLGAAANMFLQQKKGHIVVITSVAGDRGRKSNYLYGSAKGAVSIYLQGLRNRLYDSNVQVLTVKPGFVDTPMTKDFTKGMMWSTPEVVAKKIYQAINKKADLLYVPWYWQFIMRVIKIVPESLFKRLSL